MSSITAKKNGFRVPHSKQGKYDPKLMKLHRNSVKGILVSLRYLSREAEGAGLVELARMLEEAELKCSWYAANPKKNSNA